MHQINPLPAHSRSSKNVVSVGLQQGREQSPGRDWTSTRRGLTADRDFFYARMQQRCVGCRDMRQRTRRPFVHAVGRPAGPGDVVNEMSSQVPQRAREEGLEGGPLGATENERAVRTGPAWRRDDGQRESCCGRSVGWAASGVERGSRHLLCWPGATCPFGLAQKTSSVVGTGTTGTRTGTGTGSLRGCVLVSRLASASAESAVYTAPSEDRGAGGRATVGWPRCNRCDAGPSVEASRWSDSPTGCGGGAPLFFKRDPLDARARVSDATAGRMPNQSLPLHCERRGFRPRWPVRSSAGPAPAASALSTHQPGKPKSLENAVSHKPRWPRRDLTSLAVCEEQHRDNYHQHGCAASAVAAVVYEQGSVRDCHDAHACCPSVPSALLSRRQPINLLLPPFLVWNEASFFVSRSSLHPLRFRSMQRLACLVSAQRRN